MFYAHFDFDFWFWHTAEHKANWMTFHHLFCHFGDVVVMLFPNFSYWCRCQWYSGNTVRPWTDFCQSSVTVPSLSSKYFVGGHDAWWWGSPFKNTRNWNLLLLFKWLNILSKTCCSTLIAGTGLDFQPLPVQYLLAAQHTELYVKYESNIEFTYNWKIQLHNMFTN